MELTPDWLRTEVYHALSVHFPVAFLSLATLVMLCSIFLGKRHSMSYTGSFLLYTGVITAWIAIYTGDLADGVVSRSICDPTVLKDHENAAYYLTYIFSGAAVLDVALATGWFESFHRVVRICIVLLMLTGSGFLIYTGEMGASLVYNQAAGVTIPSKNCEEFE